MNLILEHGLMTYLASLVFAVCMSIGEVACAKASPSHCLSIYFKTIDVLMADSENLADTWLQGQRQAL
jgi:hypothetical protein